MTRLHLAAALALALGAAACTPSAVGGVRGHTAFAATARVERLHSPRPADEVAACFRTNAEFLPKSRFETLPDGGTRYTLAGYGLWFEEMTFSPAPDGGSDIEVKSSGAYAGNWITMLVRDRLGPLGECANQKGTEP